MKVLVIGANGFLGKHLVKKCISLDWNVTCVYHKEDKYIPKECKKYSSDKLEFLKEKYDVIFLTAAAIPYGYFNMPSAVLISANVELPIRVVKKFKDSKIIFCSSVSVYGQPEGILTEISPFNNPSQYGKSKIGAEIIIQSHGSYSILRFSSLYGLGMNQKTFLPSIINSAKRDKKIFLFGDGSRKQNYISVFDAVNYLISSIYTKNSNIYLAVDKLSYSNTDVAKIIKRNLPKCSLIYRGEDISPSFLYNNAFTDKELKYHPEVSLENGIKELINNE